MRRAIFVFLLLLAAAHAALDQSYVQTVARNGSSAIEKTMEVTIFANQLTSDGLQRMQQVCASGPRFDCSVDVDAKTVLMREGFAPGGYYSFSTDYGVPSITYTLTIDRIPTDRFSNDLDRLLAAANVTDSSGGGAARPIDLKDAATNQENAVLLKQFKANITYTIRMPVAIYDARAGGVQGSVSGNEVSFDLVEVLSESRPIVVRSSELNSGYLLAIGGVIVLAALSVTFFTSKGIRRKK
jgi:hypothetical protein